MKFDWKKPTLFILFYLVLFSSSPAESIDSGSTSTNVDMKKYEDNTATWRIADYLAFLKKFRTHLGPIGQHKKNEIEIITNPDLILEVENNEKRDLLNRGATEQEASDWSKIGVIFTDTYWIWIRDAVIFPSGHTGTYDRLMYKNSIDGPPNVAVLPFLKDGRIVLNLIYRHATRDWEVELTRGSRAYGETPLKAAYRELKEKTGFVTEGLTFLGSVAPDPVSINSVTPVFWAPITGQEFSESLDLVAFTKTEAIEALKNGYVEVDMHGEVKKIPFRDALVAYAILQALIRDLMN